uniref:Uncharacterized protein n=1 Tax=Arundo donax TaxID=35708 RepID=A0A0A9CD18_ARUDO
MDRVVDFRSLSWRGKMNKSLILQLN